MTLDELKEWKNNEARKLKKLLKSGALDETEYAVRKMHAKDRYVYLYVFLCVCVYVSMCMCEFVFV